jgi:hypothetical protein
MHVQLHSGGRTGVATAGLALGLIALAAASPARAQDAHKQANDHAEHGTEQPGHQPHEHGLHFAHPLFAESVSPDRKLRTDFARAWENEGSESEIELEAEYAFHRSFSIEAVIPYVFLSPDEGASESHLGNVELALKFANFAFEEQGVLLGYGVEFGLPTGNEDKGIGSDHIWEIEPFLNIGVKRGRLEMQAFSIFGIPTNQEEGEEIETEFKYDVTSLYHVSDRVQALLELNGLVGLSGEEAGEGIVSLSPGIKVAPTSDRHLFFGLGVSVPLGDEELDPTMRVSAFYHF